MSLRGAVSFAIPRTPPSLNTWLSRHWRVRERDKASWQQEIVAELRSSGLPRCDRVDAEVSFRFRDRRRRDVGNYVATFDKCLGDALTSGGFLPDDDHTRYQVFFAEIRPERGDPETLVVLKYVAAAKEAA